MASPIEEYFFQRSLNPSLNSSGTEKQDTEGENVELSSSLSGESAEEKHEINECETNLVTEREFPSVSPKSQSECHSNTVKDTTDIVDSPSIASTSAASETSSQTETEPITNEDVILELKELSEINDTNTETIMQGNENDQSSSEPPVINVTDEFGHMETIRAKNSTSQISDVSQSNIELEPELSKNHSSTVDSNNNSLQVFSARGALYALNEEEKQSAVLLKNVVFRYNSNSNVLNDVSLCVPKGKIYALLGSSGCGKTTLLRVILGRIRPRRGLVWTFGSRPGSSYSNVPGNGVGYMPQELAMFPHFTIGETLQYFGKLHGMSDELIREKTDFMIELLNLPPKEKKVCECSGGQQRRASIAVTLFHDPPLLILDEPTVGVDPLLRCKIWQYLEYLCKTKNMTVMITTHYVEESRSAANVAFMRFGRILTQSSPEALMKQHKCTILEDVFLKLCQTDSFETKQKKSLKLHRFISRSTSSSPTDDSSDVKNATAGGHPPKHICDSNNSKRRRSPLARFAISPSRMKALMFKNIINIKRNPLVMFFFLVLPVIQISLFCNSVTKQPNNLAVGLFNGETQGGLSQEFINRLDTKKLNIHHFESEEEAIQAVEEGFVWYAISLSKNFTRAYKKRAKNPTDLSERNFNASKIKLIVDHSDNFMYLSIFNSLLNSYQRFVEDFASKYGYNRESVRLPIETKEIVYGFYEEGESYDILNNITPPSLVVIIYTTPLILAAFVIVLERKGELIERSFVSGVTSVEILLSHLITFMLALALQVALMVATALFVFELRVMGSITEICILLYLCGLCGILIGLMISSVVKEQIVAVVLVFGFIFPFWMMCGVFWPMETIPVKIRAIFWKLPLSTPIRAIDNIVKKAWTYQNTSIFNAYLTIFGYDVGLLAFDIILFYLNTR